MHLYQGTTQQIIADATQARLANQLSDRFFDEFRYPAHTVGGNVVARTARRDRKRPSAGRPEGPGDPRRARACRYCEPSGGRNLSVFQ